jgi:hypothetical protein
MAISWSVADVLRARAVHAGGRVAVTGVLYFDEALGFRIFQTTDESYDERVVLEIDDPVAAAKLRDALVGAGEAPVYLGPGGLDGEARAAGETLILEHIFTVILGDPGKRPRDIRVIEVRPNPWAR